MKASLRVRWPILAKSKSTFDCMLICEEVNINFSFFFSHKVIYVWFIFVHMGVCVSVCLLVCDWSIYIRMCLCVYVHVCSCLCKHIFEYLQALSCVYVKLQNWVYVYKKNFFFSTCWSFSNINIFWSGLCILTKFSGPRTDLLRSRSCEFLFPWLRKNYSKSMRE